jgi:hypothetical protein
MSRNDRNHAENIAISLRFPYVDRHNNGTDKGR